MRKILPILVVGILVLSGLGAVAIKQSETKNIISENIQISIPKLIEKGDFISIDLIEADSNHWETGKPFLPVVSKLFTFEFGTIIENVEVTFSDITSQKLSKLIEPTPKTEIISLIHKTNSIKELDEVDYSDLGIYPKEQFSWKTAAGIKGKDHVIFCAVSINPIQYNTEENTISYIQNANIKIKYIPPANPINFPDEYDLLIITPSEFESTLQRFVTHKEGRNIRTKLVTLDEIPSGVGVDTQEDIKFYIKDALDTWGVDYLILVGSGVEGNEKFPVRQAWISDTPYEDYFPSDLYYADIYNSTMEFSDWDYDEDGKFAEWKRDKPDIDAIPDIHLGKIPCHTNNELNAYIDKVIWYDKHNKMTNKIVQIGGDTFPDDAGEVYEGEYANTVVLSKLPGYKTTKLWASKDELTKPNIANGFKKTLPDFFDFSGHGSPQSFATHPPKSGEHVWIPEKTLLSPYPGWYIDEFDIYNIKNSRKYPIVFYNSCSNNKYSVTEVCLSWKTIKHPEGGGIIAFGASGIGHGAHGEAETESAFGWMEVKTHEELYNTKNLGEVWSNSIIGYYTAFQSGLGKTDYKTMLEYSMFGDPTLNAQDGDDPKTRSYSSQKINIFEELIDYFPRLIKLFEIFLAKIS